MVNEKDGTYAGDINKEKRIVPHTMRSSTGTNYYLKTGNARAVQSLEN
ncbi:hypothetical protein [Eubacterium sp.]